MRVGIDVGGTFTDLVAVTPGGVLHHKEPSTPDDPSRAVADGLAVLQRAGEISHVSHGTTIGLNAIIQRKGARIALVVTAGYRDVLEIGRSRMPSSFDLYAGKEEPLVPRDRIVEIAARLGPGGRIVDAPDNAELDRVADSLRATNADAVAVLVLHGYTNPGFEADLAARLSDRLPGLPVTGSAVIWPEVREYERALVACLNAYIQPLMRDYFDRLERRLADLGVTAPVFITASNGGSLSLRSAADRPIETVLSGPASGVTAAARMAEAAGLAETHPGVVTFDMGGTSSDIAVVVEGRPELATHTTVGGLPLIVPVVAVSAIGAGGGSVIWVDEQGVLKVGPASVGADPGPVAYRRGGDRPAVTDAYLATGIIDPATFLGGRMKLDIAASADALAELGSRLGQDAHTLAASALRVATAGMATELQKLMAQRGLDPRTFALVPFGGAGPTHAALLADEVGIAHIVVPPAAATFCALGAAVADLRRDFARSLRRRLDEAGSALLASVLADLEAQAMVWLEEQGSATPEFTCAADMRYSGQAYELQVGLDAGDLGAAAVAEAFHAEHERLYGFRDADAPIELGTARLAAVGRVPRIRAATALCSSGSHGLRPQGPTPLLPAGSGAPSPSGRRRVLLGDGWHDAAVYARDALRSRDRFDGPAVVEQDDTTVLVPLGWSALVDESANLHLRKAQPDAA
ncbi:hydantoinase/oxoprolinase family protein [Flindersiella endophytica]